MVVATTQGIFDEDVARRMVLNYLRYHTNRFKSDFGPEVVIACDSRRYWRRGAFQYYKANRKKQRDKSKKFDWENVFVMLAKIRDELTENLPYKVLMVDNAEADDIIAVLTRTHIEEQGKVIILGSDRDLLQLQAYPNVFQYDPFKKKFLKEPEPLVFKKKHILCGDKSDGIPNFLSADNCYVDHIRSHQIRQRDLVNWINLPPETFCTTVEMRHGYTRNKILIDLDMIPREIQAAITMAYINTRTASKTRLLDYLIEHREMEMIEKLEEF